MALFFLNSSYDGQSRMLMDCHVEHVHFIPRRSLRTDSQLRILHHPHGGNPDLQCP